MHLRIPPGQSWIIPLFIPIIPLLIIPIIALLIIPLTLCPADVYGDG